MNDDPDEGMPGQSDEHSASDARRIRGRGLALRIVLWYLAVVAAFLAIAFFFGGLGGR